MKATITYKQLFQAVRDGEIVCAMHNNNREIGRMFHLARRGEKPDLLTALQSDKAVFAIAATEKGTQFLKRIVRG